MSGRRQSRRIQGLPPAGAAPAPAAARRPRRLRPARTVTATMLSCFNSVPKKAYVSKNAPGKRRRAAHCRVSKARTGQNAGQARSYKYRRVEKAAIRRYVLATANRQRAIARMFRASRARRAAAAAAERRAMGLEDAPAPAALRRSRRLSARR